ncbi:MAG TPA: class I SAM-dependent methyltransferase [Acidimicrobiales bacterium]
MSDPADTNALIWKSEEVVKEWVAQASDRDRQRMSHWQILSELLPYDDSDSFTFLDLGAGTGAATRTILELYPQSESILAEYSPQMIAEGERALESYKGRFRYVEFDMLVGEWPAAIPSGLDAVVTSLCIHHMPDDRKQGLFREIFERLAPGGWYLNYDPVTSEDAIVEAVWQHTNDRGHPNAAEHREHRSPLEQARWQNHVRYMIPLDRQLDYFRAAGFEGVDVYWKHLENVVYGGRRPR